nr:unnamed protein product [Callosobruchus analis]
MLQNAMTVSQKNQHLIHVAYRRTQTNLSTSTAVN